MNKEELINALETTIKDKPWQASQKVKEIIEKLKTEQQPKQRTLVQNSSLWLYATMIADELNGSGFSVQKTLAQRIEIDWNKDLVMDLMIRPLIKAIHGYDSTTQLKKVGELDPVIDHLTRFLAEKCNGLSVPFPQAEWNKKP